MDVPASGFAVDTYLKEEWQQHCDVAAHTIAAIEKPLLQLIQRSAEAVRTGGKILFFGNGGSAADAQHLATELTVRYSQNRPPIPAMALTTDTSALTAIGNDFSFNDIFARQVEALCTSADIVIGITTSGNSLNVLHALDVAHSKGAFTAAFTGGTAGKLSGSAHLMLTVPCSVTARIQEMHITIGQIFCGALEKTLGLVT